MTTPNAPVCSCEWEEALGSALRLAVSLARVNTLTAPEMDTLINLRALVHAWDWARMEAEATK